MDLSTPLGPNAPSVHLTPSTNTPCNDLVSLTACTVLLSSMRSTLCHSQHSNKRVPTSELARSNFPRASAKTALFSLALRSTWCSPNSDCLNSPLRLQSNARCLCTQRNWSQSLTMVSTCHPSTLHDDFNLWFRQPLTMMLTCHFE